MLDSPMKGKSLLYIVQLEDAAIDSAANVPGFQTEGTHSIENELMDEQTKVGRVLEPGNNTESFEITCYKDKSDGQADIMTAARKKKKIKVWEVDMTANESGDHDATFAYCVVEDLEKSSESDSFVEYSTTLQVIGESVEGTLTETDLPEGIEQAMYDFETPGETGTSTDSGGSTA